VAVRFFATAMIDTDKSDDSVNAYGDILTAMRTSRYGSQQRPSRFVGWHALVPVGIAHADCTTAGDFGAGAGCAPPGDSSGSGKAEAGPRRLWTGHRN